MRCKRPPAPSLPNKRPHALVVPRTRYKSVDDLGTPEAAAKRLLDQYLNKEFMSTRIGITRSGEVLDASSREGADGKMYYDIQVGGLADTDTVVRPTHSCITGGGLAAAARRLHVTAFLDNSSWNIRRFSRLTASWRSTEKPCKQCLQFVILHGTRPLYILDVHLSDHVLDEFSSLLCHGRWHRNPLHASLRCETRVQCLPQIRMSSYASRNPYVSTVNERMDGYGLEWDRRLLTTLGVANNRLYELRLQTRMDTWDGSKDRISSIFKSFRCFEVEV